MWIGYDSPRALRRKLEYARDLGLGGVMFWEASTDVRGDGADSLIRVASETLAQPSTWQEWTERWWSVEERLNPQLAGEDADPDGDGLLNLLEYASGRDPLTADGRSILITRWDGETGRFIVRFDKSPGVSDLAYGFEAWSGPDAGESWSGASLEVLTDNEAVLEAADVSTPTEAGSRMIRLRVTRQ